MGRQVLDWHTVHRAETHSEPCLISRPQSWPGPCVEKSSAASFQVLATSGCKSENCAIQSNCRRIWSLLSDWLTRLTLLQPEVARTWKSAVACIPPYQGWSYVLSFQSNQSQATPTYIWINLLMYALVLLYYAKQPFQVQLSRRLVAWPRMNTAIIPRSLLGLLSHRILKPTEVFLLYICVLTTLSNYAGGLGCEADCQFMVANTLTVTCTQSACAAGAGYSN